MKAITVAKLFLFWNKKFKDNPITNLKLQKLLYYAQGLSFIELKKELFSDNIIANIYCPDVPNVYNRFKHFKNSYIEYNINEDLYIEKKFNKETLNFLKEFYEAYSIMPAFELSEQKVLFEPNKNTYLNKKKDKTIKKTLIKKYFEEWK